jgi:very-short-patch-repair endonuclease
MENDSKVRRGLRNGQRSTAPERIERARTLRKDASISERVLWMWLRKERTGFRFRRQHPVDKFTLDFYCAEALLNVELDGEQHAETRDRDAERDSVLRNIGLEIIRIPTLDLFEKSQKLDYWIRIIVQACELRTGRSGKIPEFW